MQVSEHKANHSNLPAKKQEARTKLSTVLRGVWERIQIEKADTGEHPQQRRKAMQTWVAELNSISKNVIPNAQLQDMREILRRIYVVEIYLQYAKNHTHGTLTEIRNEFSKKPMLV